MSIPRFDRHPDHVRSVRREQQQLPGLAQQGATEHQHHEEDAQSKNLSRLLQEMCKWDHGYFKMRRSSDTADLHLTWTWTLTSSAGSYVYVKVNYWDVELGLDMLCRKIFEVDEGIRKPTPDKRNSRHT